jgi:hypothetical protein
MRRPFEGTERNGTALGPEGTLVDRRWTGTDRQGVAFGPDSDVGHRNDLAVVVRPVDVALGS